MKTKRLLPGGWNPWCPVCGRDSAPTNKACGECSWRRAEAYRTRVALWAAGARGTATPEVVTAVLHVGFLSVPETEEQLARLRGEEVRPAAPARSGVTTCNAAGLAPIDRVAARVVVAGGVA